MLKRKALAVVAAVAVAFTMMPTLSFATESDGHPSVNKNEQTPEYKPNEAVVLMKDSLSQKAVKSELSSCAKGLSVTATTKIQGEKKTVAVVRSLLGTEKLVEKLSKDEDVLIAEPNYVYREMDVTNDPYADRQWSYDDSLIDVERDNGYTGRDRVVAVVDSGIDYTNPEFSDRMWTNKFYPTLKGNHGYDFVNVDSSPIDDCGHGTHCAGIIAAKRNNNEGIKGVSDAKLMAVKVFDSEGGGYLSSIINGYNYILKAQKLGVNIVAVNNSWGGESDSRILTEMIDMIGKGGALSVCAAGNETLDNDKNETFPACCDSDYVISVAATDISGNLAFYSNWGSKSVDIAAPGSNIWSTVSYDCFNPGLYDDQKRAELTESWCDFDDDIASDYEIQTYTSDREVIDNNYTITYVDGLNGEGKAAKITFTMKKDDLAYVRIPYTSGTDNRKHISTIFRTGSRRDWSGIFRITDFSREATVDEVYDEIKDDWDKEYIFKEEENYWEHADYRESNKDGDERYMYISLLCEISGEMTLTLDNVGISKDVSSDQFGKYDLYSGTSMATPMVTGAVALKSEEIGSDPLETKAALLSNVNRTADLNVKTKGSLDFSREYVVPHISGAHVNGDNVVVTGYGLKDTDISINGTNANIVSTKRGSVTVKNEGWTNKVIDITVSNSNGTDTKENVYLVKGKKKFQTINSSRDTDIYEDFASDGKYIYATNGKAISKKDASKKNASWDYIAYITPKKFGEKNLSDKYDNYGVVLDSSIAYCNGRVYFIAGCGEIIMREEVIEEGDLGEGSWYEITEVTEVLCSGKYKLMSVSATSGKVRIEKTLPSNLNKTESATLAAYNGRIYVMGGYDCSSGEECLTSKVNVYNPVKKTWTTGKSLPSKGAEGQAVQSGNRLIYMSKVSEKNEPELCIFNGKSWKIKNIDALCDPFVMKRDVNKYYRFNTALGICRSNGHAAVAVCGIPTEYGDIFTYDLVTGRFKDTGYQYSDKLSYSDSDFLGIAVGKQFIINEIESGDVSKMSLNSGLIKVATSKKGKGKVTATREYVPGNKVVIKAKANKGYYVKSVKIGSKTTKYSGKKSSKTIVVSNKIISPKNVKITFQKR